MGFHTEDPGGGKEPRVCFRGRVRPNLTDPSCTDGLPLPTRTPAVFPPKEQRAKGGKGSNPLRGTLQSQTTLDEVCLALDYPLTS